MASPYQIPSSSQRKRKYTFENVGSNEVSALPLSETAPLPIPPQQRGDFSSLRSQFSSFSPLTTQRQLPLFSLIGNSTSTSAPMFPSSGISPPMFPSSGISSPMFPSSGIRVPHSDPVFPSSGIRAPCSAPMFPSSGIRFSQSHQSTRHSNLPPVSPQVPYPPPRMPSFLPQHGSFQNIPVSSFTPAVINIESLRKKARVFETGASSNQGVTVPEASFLFHRQIHAQTSTESPKNFHEISIPTNRVDDLSEERLLVTSYTPIDRIWEVWNAVNRNTAKDNFEIDEMNNWWDEVYKHDPKE